MSNSTSSVYYLGPSHWFKQLNNFSLSCPCAFGLVLFTAARLGVKRVLICFPFSLFPNAGAARGPTCPAVGPFLTKGQKQQLPPQPAQGLPTHQKPTKRRSLPSPPQPKAGDIKQIYACSLSSACTSGFCPYSS